MMDFLSKETITKLRELGKSCGDADKPDAVFWACKDGSVRLITATHIDWPCSGCDCGLVEILEFGL